MAVHIRRREFMFTLGGAAAAGSFAAHAQQAGKLPLIGYLSPGSAAVGPLARHDAFQEGLRDLGYIDGKNIAIAYRFAEGKFDRLAELAAELVELKVDVIVSVVTQASLAAKNATSKIPIVMVSVGDPVASGLVANLARPGANVTGTAGMTAEIIGKSLQLLKESIPNLSRVAVLWNPSNVVFQGQIIRKTEDAARKLALELQTFGVRGPDEFDAAFTAMSDGRADALLVLPDPVLAFHQIRIADLAKQHRLPSMFGLRDHAAAGGLLAYGPDYAQIYRRAAAYVDKILKGIRPADLPVEQPTKFELVVNLRTAKELGLTIPPSILAVADEVIE
jgi:putative tryptophan/tyrosine transport system substrate-binding protein